MVPTNLNVVCGLVSWNQNILSMKILDNLLQCLKEDLGLGGKRLVLCEYIFIRLSTILKILSFHSFTALHSTLSRLRHQLPISFNADAITFLHLLKLIWEGNLYGRGSGLGLNDGFDVKL